MPVSDAHAAFLGIVVALMFLGAALWISYAGDRVLYNELFFLGKKRDTDRYRRTSSLLNAAAQIWLLFLAVVSLANAIWYLCRWFASRS